MAIFIVDSLIPIMISPISYTNIKTNLQLYYNMLAKIALKNVGVPCVVRMKKVAVPWNKVTKKVFVPYFAPFPSSKWILYGL